MRTNDRAKGRVTRVVSGIAALVVGWLMVGPVLAGDEGRSGATRPWRWSRASVWRVRGASSPVS